MVIQLISQSNLQLYKLQGFHLFKAYETLSEKIAILIPRHAHARVRMSG